MFRAQLLQEYPDLEPQDIQQALESFKKPLPKSRVLLTFDLDFGEILALSGTKSVSVLPFRIADATSSNLIQRLEKVLPDVAESLESGAIVVVEDTRHRVRHLPLPGRG